VSTKEGGVLEDWMLDWLAVKSNDYGMSTSHERSDKMVGGERQRSGHWTRTWILHSETGLISVHKEGIFHV
jgi:hypothetical protein